MCCDADMLTAGMNKTFGQNPNLMQPKAQSQSSDVKTHYCCLSLIPLPFLFLSFNDGGRQYTD